MRGSVSFGHGHPSFMCALIYVCEAERYISSVLKQLLHLFFRT
jgi:hypothetical protein